MLNISIEPTHTSFWHSFNTSEFWGLEILHPDLFSQKLQESTILYTILIFSLHFLDKRLWKQPSLRILWKCYTCLKICTRLLGVLLVTNMNFRPMAYRMAFLHATIVEKKVLYPNTTTKLLIIKCFQFSLVEEKYKAD